MKYLIQNFTRQAHTQYEAFAVHFLRLSLMRAQQSFGNETLITMTSFCIPIFLMTLYVFIDLLLNILLHLLVNVFVTFFICFACIITRYYQLFNFSKILEDWCAEGIFLHF